MRILTALLISITFCLNLQAQKKQKFDHVFTLTTDLGEIVFILYDETPKHKANFLKLTEDGFYDGTTFHRIIDGFMIQGGDPNSKDEDPNNDGSGGPGYRVDAEIVEGLYHKKGAIAAARQGDRANPERESSGSQFYIVQGKKLPAAALSQFEKRGTKFTEQAKKDYEEIGGTPHLDGAYTVFGEVIQGLDIIDIIASQEKNNRDRPIEDIKMTITAKKMKRKKITKLFKYGYSAQ